VRNLTGLVWVWMQDAVYGVHTLLDP